MLLKGNLRQFPYVSVESKIVSFSNLLFAVWYVLIFEVSPEILAPLTIKFSDYKTNCYRAIP